MLYENIESKCRERSISISALERAVGLSNATIRGWKKSAPRVDSLKKVSDYFGCTVDDLMANTSAARGKAKG